MLGRLAGWLCSADRSAGRPGKAGVDGFFSHLLSRHPVCLSHHTSSNFANKMGKNNNKTATKDHPTCSCLHFGQCHCDRTRRRGWQWGLQLWQLRNGDVRWRVRIFPWVLMNFVWVVYICMVFLLCSYFCILLFFCFTSKHVFVFGLQALLSLRGEVEFHSTCYDNESSHWDADSPSKNQNGGT